MMNTNIEQKIKEHIIASNNGKDDQEDIELVEDNKK